MNEHDDQMHVIRRVHRWRSALFGLIILIAGMLIGSAVTLVVVTEKSEDRPGGVEYISTRTVRHLQGELNLRPEQSEQIERILTEHLSVLREIREEARPRVEEQMRQLHEEVLSVLDEQQRMIWEEKMRQLHRRYGGRHGDRLWGPGRRDRRGDGPEPDGWREPRSPNQPGPERRRLRGAQEPAS